MASSVTAASMRRGDHACSSCPRIDERALMLAPFLSGGLDAGERVLYLHHDSSDEDVLDMVSAAGRDPRPAARNTALQTRPASNVYASDGIFDPDRTLRLLTHEANAARAAGFSGLRIVAEMSWAADGMPGSDRLDDYERRANALFGPYRLTAVCLYDHERFRRSLIPVAAHPLAVEPAGRVIPGWLQMTETDEPYGLRLEGEVDFATSVHLAEALTRLVDRADGDAHVDLSGLRFIDAGATRLLFRAARQLAPRRRLILTAPSRAVDRLLQLLDDQCSANMEIRRKEGTRG